MVSKKQAGFTVVEFLIAISIFSTIMILAITVIMSISKLYQKASYTSQLNSTSRNLHQELAVNLTYHSQYVVLEAGDKQGFCVGNDVYYYELSSDSNIYEGLYKAQKTSTDPCTQAVVSTILANGVNLLPKNGFVTKLSIITDTSMRRIETSFRVGTADMFEGDNVGNNCRSTLRGGDFCSVVDYNSNVRSRL